MDSLLPTWTLALAHLLVWGVEGAAAHGFLDGEQRPLWILEDGLAKRQRLERPEEDYATTTREPAQGAFRRQGRGGLGGHEPAAITFLVRHEDESRPLSPPPPARPPSQSQRRFMMPRRLQLPHQYVQPQKKSQPWHKSQRRESRRHLPVFDNGPGENSLRPVGGSHYPVFVYNGTRGELILNTMLSRRRYPMQEPVPGQVLYPPSTPMFRPKPIVERFRLPGQREVMNLTLIPFYAHEAIADPNTRLSSTQQPPPATPTPLFETQLPRTQELAQSRRRPKKAKQYEAFHSPQEVMQWQSVLRRSTAHGRHHPKSNHRHYPSEEVDLQEDNSISASESGSEEAPQEEDPEGKPHWDDLEEQEATATESSTSEGPFQIVYLDESLERPVVDSPTSTTTPSPQVLPLRQSSRYALKKQYYAFPVYTLGKLLQTQSPAAKPVLEKTDRAVGNSEERELPSSTWFILNSRSVFGRQPSMSYSHLPVFRSRYKGPHYRRLDNQTKYYTSKYVGNAFRPR
ncbi:uncharacterized protein [Drosophila bipectinata]|uniref:uncharacterized protein n=1 Tax=Drosophila bipectinata TaxID=42026 RepID=UPI001C89C362|nr:uncharacterized protein LOC108121679 [Drosophila bipectinata]